MKLNQHKLRYVIIPGRNPKRSLKKYYDAAYECWKDVWLDAFKELENTDTIYSDDFTRQDEIGALFDGDRCIGMAFFRRADLSQPEDREDSYFKIWSPSAIEQLTQFGTNIIVCSYFTVHRDFRQQIVKLAVKDVVMALLVEYFRHSEADAMTGTMRNNKGMNDCTYRHGATPLVRDIEHHGVKVDLVGFFKDSIKYCDLPEEAELARIAWKQRLPAPVESTVLEAA